jgi:hypothetical protein
MSFRTEQDVVLRKLDGCKPTPCRFVHSQRLTIAGQAQDVTFSVRGDSESIRSACNLLNARYGWRGYGSSHNIPSDQHYTTFTAEVERSVIGTVTLGIDSDSGLSVDRTFSEEIDRARMVVGSKICELTKLAIDPNVRSKAVLAKLFHIAFIYGTSVSSSTDLFIEVSPRHVIFYEAMLGFCRVGCALKNMSVGVQSQLMRLKIDDIRLNIRKFTGREGAPSRRSLYPHFFSSEQESEIRTGLILAYKGSVRRAA